MPRGGATLLVTGFGPNTNVNDLACKFEKYGRLNGCAIYTQATGEEIAVVGFTVFRDAEDAQSDMGRETFYVEVLAFCIGVSWRLCDKTYTILIGDDVDRPSIGKELWYFLRSLSPGQWTSLEGKLRNEVKWVAEGKHVGKKEQNLYGSRFTKNGTKCYGPYMKDLLERSHSHPAYALNMVAKSKLVHMVYHETETHSPTKCGRTRAPKSSILTHVDFAYRVNFPTKKLQSLQDGKWITVPLSSDKALQALNQLELNEHRTETLACIELGPAYPSRPGQAETPKVNAKDKTNRSAETRAQRARSNQKSGAAFHSHVFEDDLNKGLVSAASEGNSKKVAQCIKHGAHVNAIKGGLTALMEAATEGHIDIVEMLLKNKADTRTKDPWGNTALHLATIDGHQDIVKLLLENGANPIPGL